MNPAELSLLLDRLRAEPVEREWLEFKYNEDPHTIGEYFAALANAAALDGRDFGYMVWGVRDRTHEVLGTRFNPDTTKEKNQSLERFLHSFIRPKLDVRFHCFEYQGKTVVLACVPATTGQPASFHEVEYIRLGSEKVLLSKHPGKEAALWERLKSRNDWSAELVPGANEADLDPAALVEGRRLFTETHPRLEADIASWDALTLLAKLKLYREGHITRAGLLLFGREEAAALLPMPPQVSWILKDAEGTALDYKHFELPLLRVPDALFARVRNLTVRYLQPGTLFPTEVPQYDPWVIREALHNCLAHQDYAQGGRVNVIELPEALVFSNVGRFLPGSVEALLSSDSSPEQYRNPCLAQAMVSLKLIDTVGSGVRRMYREQRKRLFPMPDYLIDVERQRVEVRLTGRQLDERFTQLLASQPDLSLLDVFLLDKVQKQKALTAEEAKSLRARKLIEGRVPRYHLSARVAKALGKEADYVLNKGLNKAYYQTMVLKRLNMGDCMRADLEQLLLDKLPDVLDAERKKTKVKNLLSEMARLEWVGALRKGPGTPWTLKPAGKDKLAKEGEG